MRAKIDCVAITDHNTGEWIERLQNAYEDLNEERPSGFRPLHLFPGVELTVGQGVHLLAIFSPGKGESETDALLGAVGFPMEKKGTMDAVAKQSVPEAAATIREHGALPISAHADRTCGIFTRSSGAAMKSLLADSSLTAIEVMDPSSEQPGAYRDYSPQLAEVLGSDSHHPRGTPDKPVPGSRFTWVKMGEPSLEGLRLALLDGMDLSILRSDQTDSNPNDEPPINIESVEIRDAYFMGHGTPAIASMSPRLTGIIGGRGTGKSTLIELMRLALRRENDLHVNSRPAFDRFAQVGSRSGSGALETSTEVVVKMRKGGSRYRIRWRYDGDRAVIERQSASGWVSEPGDVRSRFPVRILSQKEVLALAESPAGLLRHIDAGLEAQHGWSARREKLEAEFMAKRAEERSLQAQLGDRDRLEGELADLEHQMHTFEQAGHRSVLRDFQRLARQEKVFTDWEKSLTAAAAAIHAVAEDVDPDDLPSTDFAPSDAESDATAMALLKDVSARRTEVADRLRDEARGLESYRVLWRRDVQDSRWQTARVQARRAYDRLVQELERAGVTDPTAYGGLIQRHRTLRAEVTRLDSCQERMERARAEAVSVLADIEDIRRRETDARAAFLNSVLGDNELVRIEVVPFGLDAAAAEDDFRRAIAREDGRLEAAILQADEGELANLYADLPDDPTQRMQEMADRIQHLKSKLQRWSQGGGSVSGRQHLINHLQKLNPEQLDRLLLWWPEDGVDARYRRDAHHGFVSLRQGSPGQKSAAMLAFLLSHGEEPILLDQPEDDLDNALIYDLIVHQIRENKKRRQVIVVTHNPNILVNGDAELVIRMNFMRGQCVVSPQETGCLQESAVRKGVCQVMEGGEQAFENRYRRLKES